MAIKSKLFRHINNPCA